MCESARCPDMATLLKGAGRALRSRQRSPLSRLPLYIVTLAICPAGVRGGMFAPVNNSDTE